MRPIPIPDDAIWAGAERRVISPPNGDLTHPDIAPVEALIDVSNGGVPRLSVCLQLEGTDLAKLVAGGTVWISFYGHMVPWSADVKGPGE